jgi:alkanesulfonate monooxygenase SsuD/methylene tetrahydromethanopterin reductase-like flavin-dependent oxidoreductase (luciferase family)
MRLSLGPPQGHPVLFQAGSSEVGREVAARFAEGVFTPQHTLLKGRFRCAGGGLQKPLVKRRSELDRSQFGPI